MTYEDIAAMTPSAIEEHLSQKFYGGGSVRRRFASSADMFHRLLRWLHDQGVFFRLGNIVTLAPDGAFFCSLYIPLTNKTGMWMGHAGKTPEIALARCTLSYLHTACPTQHSDAAQLHLEATTSPPQVRPRKPQHQETRYVGTHQQPQPDLPTPASFLYGAGNQGSPSGEMLPQ